MSEFCSSNSTLVDERLPAEVTRALDQLRQAVDGLRENESASGYRAGTAALAEIERVSSGSVWSAVLEQTEKIEEEPVKLDSNWSSAWLGDQGRILSTGYALHRRLPEGGLEELGCSPGGCIVKASSDGRVLYLDEIDRSHEYFIGVLNQDHKGGRRFPREFHYLAALNSDGSLALESSGTLFRFNSAGSDYEPCGKLELPEQTVAAPAVFSQDSSLLAAVLYRSETPDESNITLCRVGESGQILPVAAAALKESVCAVELLPGGGGVLVVSNTPEDRYRSNIRLYQPSADGQRLVERAFRSLPGWATQIVCAEAPARILLVQAFEGRRDQITTLS